MTNYEKLIEVYDKRRALETSINKKKSDFEATIEYEKAALKDLQDQEDLLREEAILSLDEAGQSSVKVGNLLISKQVRVGKRITSPSALKSALSANKTKVEALGYSLDELNGCFDIETVIINRAPIEKLVKDYAQVEGIILNGVDSYETKFITIKEE